MSERQRRDRIHDQRPPSRQMRRLLRQAFFAVHRLLRGFRNGNDMRAEEAIETREALELCRRAVAREPHPDWLGPLSKAVPPGHAEAVAALTVTLETLAAVDLAWDRRLAAAGIDPR